MSDAIFINAKGERSPVPELSPKAKKDLVEIRKKVEADLKPLYDELGVNPKTEELHRTNGEVFVINKKTGKRRELGSNQREFNNKLWNFSISYARKEND